MEPSGDLCGRLFNVSVATELRRNRHGFPWRAFSVSVFFAVRTPVNRRSSSPVRRRAALCLQKSSVTAADVAATRRAARPQAGREGDDLDTFAAARVPHTHHRVGETMCRRRCASSVSRERPRRRVDVVALVDTSDPGYNTCDTCGPMVTVALMATVGLGIEDPYNGCVKDPNGIDLCQNQPTVAGAGAADEK